MWSVWDFWRIKTASKFGQLEHWSARFLGIGLIYLYIWWPTTADNDRLVILKICVLLWIIYIISHTVEKMFYGRSRR